MSGLGEVEYLDPNTYNDPFDNELKAFSTFLEERTIAQDYNWTQNSRVTGTPLDPQHAGHDCLFCPEQGHEVMQRRGNRVLLKSVFVTGYVRLAGRVTTANYREANSAFLAMVVDTQNNNSTGFSPGQLFENSWGNQGTYPGTLASDVLCPHPIRRAYNASWGQRYQVLDCCRIHLGPRFAYYSTQCIESGIMVPFELRWQGNMEVNFSDPSDTQGSIVDNCVHMVGNAFGDTDLLCAYNVRCGYVDL